MVEHWINCTKCGRDFRATEIVRSSAGAECPLCKESLTGYTLSVKCARCSKLVPHAAHFEMLMRGAIKPVCNDCADILEKEYEQNNHISVVQEEKEVLERTIHDGGHEAGTPIPPITSVTLTVHL